MNIKGNIKYYYLILVVSLLVFVICGLQKTGYSPDDTYIYMQYARSIAAGNGFVFNAGEQSYGVTSPIWSLLISISYLIGMNGFWFAKGLDLLCALGAMIMFFRLTRLFFENDSILRYISTGVFIINPWFIRWSFSGMETSLGILLVITVFYFYYSEKYNSAFLFSGILFLVRPEAFVLFFVLLLMRIIDERGKGKEGYVNLLRYASLTGIVVVPFLTFAYFNFGTIFCNTSLGKALLLSNPILVIPQTKEVLRIFVGIGPIEVILFFVLFALVIYRKSFKQYSAVYLWVAGLLLLYILSVAGVMSRYFLIIYPFAALLGFKGLDLMRLKKYYFPIALYILCLAYSQFIFYNYVRPHTDNFTRGINECFIPLGKWINENTPSGSKILVNDVGAIGYYANRYIIDGQSLINKDKELNKRLRGTNVIEREEPHNLLKFINADYVVERDTLNEVILQEAGGKHLKFKAEFVFPGLWVEDTRPKYYRVYEIVK